jgi:hypothetical protein
MQEIPIFILYIGPCISLDKENLMQIGRGDEYLYPNHVCLSTSFCSLFPQKGTGSLSCSSDKVSRLRQAPVAHACNPSYSGGRDQEGCI